MINDYEMTKAELGKRDHVFSLILTVFFLGCHCLCLKKQRLGGETRVFPQGPRRIFPASRPPAKRERHRGKIGSQVQKKLQAGKK